jgi:hypothetical protein
MITLTTRTAYDGVRQRIGCRDGSHFDQTLYSVHTAAMSQSRIACLVGGILLAVGGVLCGGAFVAEATSDPDGGANIGAGALLFVGQPLAYVGVVLLFVSLALHARSNRSPQRRG